MTTVPKASSERFPEIDEAARLLERIFAVPQEPAVRVASPAPRPPPPPLRPAVPPPPARQAAPPPVARPAPRAPAPILSPALTPPPFRSPIAPLPAKPAAPAAPESKPPATRGEALEQALAAMCRRGGFRGAALADDDGLPLAALQSPVGPEAIAAFTTVLGITIQRASQFLGTAAVNHLSLDVGVADKVVLRRFEVEGRPYYLLVQSTQGADERSEVELTLPLLARALSAS